MYVFDGMLAKFGIMCSHVFLCHFSDCIQFNHHCLPVSDLHICIERLEIVKYEFDLFCVYS